MKRLTVFSFIVLCALLALPANTTVQAHQYTSDAAFVADVTVPDDTVFAPGERFDNELPSLLGHPQEDEPIDPEVTPAGSPEPGDVINNIAQHVAEGLAEGERYEVRAIDEAVMFRDKAAWDSGETAKQTGWWEVIRAEADFLLGKDSQGNEFWVSANGDSEATHLDIRPAKIVNEDLGEGEKVVKGVEDDFGKEIQEKIQQPQQVKPNVDLFAFDNPDQKINNSGVEGAKCKIFGLISKNGERYLQIGALSDNGTMILTGLIELDALEDSQLGEWFSQVDPEKLALSDLFTDTDQSEEPILVDTRPLTPEEEHVIARRSSLNGVIPNKVTNKIVDTFWVRGISVKDYDYGSGNRAEVRGMNVFVDEAYKDPKENSSDFILILNAESYGDNRVVAVVNGPEKTIKVRINGSDFTMFRLLRNPSNDDPIRVEQTDWTLGDFLEGADVSFYLTDKNWERIMRFLANPSAKEIEVEMDSGLVNTH